MIVEDKMAIVKRAASGEATTDELLSLFYNFLNNKNKKAAANNTALCDHIVEYLLVLKSAGIAFDDDEIAKKFNAVFDKAGSDLIELIKSGGLNHECYRIYSELPEDYKILLLVGFPKSFFEMNKSGSLRNFILAGRTLADGNENLAALLQLKINARPTLMPLFDTVCKKSGFENDEDRKAD